MLRSKFTPCPELTLKPAERRKRYRRMERMAAGGNALTKRQLRRLPNRDTPSAKRKERKMLKRVLKRQGLTMADLT
jgi:hypothetical protein